MEFVVSNTGLFTILFAISYFLIIRPQQKKIKIHQNIIKEIKNGDHVTTSSGIIGTVIKKEKNSLTIEISPKINIKIIISSIIKINKNEKK